MCRTYIPATLCFVYKALQKSTDYFLSRVSIAQLCKAQYQYRNFVGLSVCPSVLSRAFTPPPHGLGQNTLVWTDFEL